MRYCPHCNYAKEFHDRDHRLINGKLETSPPGSPNSRVCLLVPNDEGTAMRADHEEYARRQVAHDELRAL